MDFELLDDAEARVLRAWVAFRLSHDLEKAELACCERTKELFRSLQAFEDTVRRPTHDS